MIEGFLDGPEVSLFCLCDGHVAVPLQPAQDFKRAYDGGQGPNTGGMGAYSPLPWAPDDLAEDVLARVAQPVVDEMARRGTPFVGLLYCGLALTSRGLRVVEFNVRFGDPETQCVLARLVTPLAGLLRDAACGDLGGAVLAWSESSAVTVVLARRDTPALLGREIRSGDCARRRPRTAPTSSTQEPRSARTGASSAPADACWPPSESGRPSPRRATQHTQRCAKSTSKELISAATSPPTSTPRVERHLGASPPGGRKSATRAIRVRSDYAVLGTH